MGVAQNYTAGVTQVFSLSLHIPKSMMIHGLRHGLTCLLAFPGSTSCLNEGRTVGQWYSCPSKVGVLETVNFVWIVLKRNQFFRTVQPFIPGKEVTLTVFPSPSTSS